MGNYLTKKGLSKYTAKLKDYISKAKVAKATDADTITGHTVGIDVPITAKFTDTTYAEATDISAGLLSVKDKKYLDTLESLVIPTNEEGDTNLNLKTSDGVRIIHNDSTVLASFDYGDISIGDGADENVTIEGNETTIKANTVNIHASDTLSLLSSDTVTIGGSATASLTLKGQQTNIEGREEINLNTKEPSGNIFFTTKADDGEIFKNNIGQNSLADIGDGSITGAIRAAYEKPVVGRVTVGARTDYPIGIYATSEGIGNIASGEACHTEGCNTQASGHYAHAEGYDTVASGYISHASGCGTAATRWVSHSEGLDGVASGVGAHVEGTYAVGFDGQGGCYTELDVTIKEIPSNYINLVKTTTGLTDPIFYIYYTNLSENLTYLEEAIQESSENGGEIVHLFDNPLMADEFYNFGPSQAKTATITSLCNKPAIYFGNPSFKSRRLIDTMLNKNLEKIWVAAEFNRTYKYSSASGAASHCEGGGNAASGHYSHAEGVWTIASGMRSHSQGCETTASGKTAFASGCSTVASGQCSHAAGQSTTASGDISHAEGQSTTASGFTSHAEGELTTASGNYSHAEGFYTTASGLVSHAEGNRTIASNFASHACGKYNADMTTGGSGSNKTGTAFVIGNGTSSAKSNAFSVQFSGITKAANTITASTTADYAEFFEWLDKNPNAEDRVGYFVTLDEDKIKIAEADDDYILGVISGAPFVLGNGDCDVWNGMYLRDEFRRLKEEPAPKLITVKNPKTKKFETQEVEGEYEGTRYIINPDYDASQEYKSRFDRPEWAAVGMLGVLPVRHDGTAQVNGYVTVGPNGIATACERTAANAYRVIKENSDSVVEIIFK